MGSVHVRGVKNGVSPRKEESKMGSESKMAESKMGSVHVSTQDSSQSVHPMGSLCEINTNKTRQNAAKSNHSLDHGLYR